MKVAILSFYSGHIERGVETWAHQLSNSLSKHCEVTVFQTEKLNTSLKTKYTIKVIKNVPNWQNKDAKNTFLRRFFLDYWSRQIALFTLRSLSELHQGNYDIIIPTNGGWQSLIVKLFCIFNKKALVIVGHSGLGWDDRWNLYLFPKIFVALSSMAAQWAKNINPSVRVRTIPNGVDLDIFKPNGPTAQVVLKKPIILAASALETNKRIHLAIKAVSLVPHASLLILGNGAELDKLRALAEQKIPGRFSIISVPFSDMPKYYRSASAFTLPSWEHEAFGMVYLEALASNLPVVAPDDTLRREIVGEAGILTSPSDTKEYAAALEKALHINWATKPRKQAERFSWEKVGSMYLDLFTNLTNET